MFTRIRVLLAAALFGLGGFLQPASAQTIASTTISTADTDCSPTTSCAFINMVDVPSVGIYLNVGTSGTFVFEASTSADPRAANPATTGTWFAINDDAGAAASATADGILFFTNSGYTGIRFRASAISGDATVVAARGPVGLKSTATVSGGGDFDAADFNAAFGTAGTADAQVLSVQGIASMTPLLATVTATNLDVQSGGADLATEATLASALTALQLIDNAVSGAGFNITQFGGVTATAATLSADNLALPTAPFVNSVNLCYNGATLDLCTLSSGGAGAVDANTTRVTLGTNDSIIAIEDVAETAAGAMLRAGTVRRDAAASSAGATGDNATANTDALGLLWTRTFDPCSSEAKTYYVVNLAAAATVEIANAVASEFFYICSVNLVTAGANAVLIASDDSDGCGSLTAGLNGGTTAATGWTFAANGGIALGNGESTVMKTGTAAHYLCMAPSTTAQLSGTIAYVSAP